MIADGGLEGWEPLADLLMDERDKYPRVPDDMDSCELARVILASEWLATRERIAAANALWDAAKSAPFSPSTSARVHRWLVGRADRIAGDA